MKPFILIPVFLGITISAIAQTALPVNTLRPGSKNIVKLNITSPILKNYAVQYERVINKRLSIAVSGRIMPATTIPLKGFIKRQIIQEDNQLVSDIINKVDFSNFAITPEVRFYLSKKGYGEGFYVGPYYRFAKYKMHATTLSYEVEADQSYDLSLSGDLSTNTVGILIGSQWHLSKHFSLDLWIAGPSFGGASGNIIGISNQTLPAEAQDELRTYLDNIDIPFVRESITVNANGGRIDAKGSWAGVRTGILVAFRF
ncbi:DUF3575 domain-containing protein [Niabella ginsengisoli]|uniref:DUF3575 domain-containing protein n=1 Tax=Niabella ginsengisoli TaxID=522298 RepID=A0ABS9SNS9_9BACT|nr:DUF3575 domain-containing protein [Niabella ginsengisoli]MCH5600044.1 DUF3575 domain-containing protein [Niabella ginsengisoli]